MDEIGDFRCSGSVLGNFYCTWTLPNFSTYDYTFKKCYNSGFSHVMQQSELKYYLRIYPGGDEEEGYVSCFLFFHFPSAYQKLPASFTISFLNENGNILATTSHEPGEKYLFKRGGWGGPKMITRKNLFSKLTNDTLLISVEGLYSISAVTMNNATKYFSEVSPFERLELKEKESEKEGANDAHVCVENTNLPVDKSVLIASSKVFAAMFKHDTMEKRTREIKIEDLDVQTVTSMLKFMQTGRVKSLNFNLAVKLLRAADKYGLDNLKTVCALFLRSQIDSKNFDEILVCAETFNVPTLRQEAIQYIRENRTVINFDDQSLLKEHPKLLLEIIQVMAKQ